MLTKKSGGLFFESSSFVTVFRFFDGTRTKFFGNALSRDWSYWSTFGSTSATAHLVLLDS